jgi:tRNA-2-methylthio-N6-dimethylallyladenosine synthase
MTVSTDIIVGFPQESDQDLTDTLTLMIEARFMGAYAFKYSPRPGTPALRFVDDVPEKIKAERLAKVFEVSDDLQASYLASLIGTEQKVLIEAVGARDVGKLEGHTDRNEIVHVIDAADPQMIGQIVPVRITRAFRHSLEAELLSSRSSAASRRLPVISTPS